MSEIERAIETANKLWLDELKKIHFPGINEEENHCRECYNEYPCNTIKLTERLGTRNESH